LMHCFKYLKNLKFENCGSGEKFREKKSQQWH
jgi:hypothetical protein